MHVLAFSQPGLFENDRNIRKMAVVWWYNGGLMVVQWDLMGFDGIYPVVSSNMAGKSPMIS